MKKTYITEFFAGLGLLYLVVTSANAQDYAAGFGHLQRAFENRPEERVQQMPTQGTGGTPTGLQIGNSPNYYQPARACQTHYQTVYVDGEAQTIVVCD